MKDIFISYSANDMKMADLVPYIAAQVLGGLVALELSKHIKL